MFPTWILMNQPRWFSYFICFYQGQESRSNLFLSTTGDVGELNFRLDVIVIFWVCETDYYQWQGEKKRYCFKVLFPTFSYPLTRDLKDFSWVNICVANALLTDFFFLLPHIKRWWKELGRRFYCSFGTMTLTLSHFWGRDSKVFVSKF